MSRWTRVLATFGVAAALPFVAGLSPLPPTATAAVAGNIYNCWANALPPNGAESYCAYGNRGVQVRAAVRCDGFWSDYDRYGPWQNTPTGVVSRIYCDKTADDRLQYWWEVKQPA